MIALVLALATDLCPVGDELAVAHGGLVVGERAFGEARRVQAIAASPDGTLLAEVGGLAAEHGRVTVWDVGKAEVLWSLELHEDLIYDVAWSPDGSLLYTASGDGTIGRLQADGTPLAPLEGHSSQVLCLAVAADGTLASGSLDRTVRVWREGELQRALTRHAGAINGLSFAPDGKQLATASSDGTVRVWQHAIGRQRKIVDLEQDAVLEVLWDERGLFAGTERGTICRLDWLRARVEGVVATHQDWVRSLALVEGELISLDATGEQLATPLD